MCQLSATSIPYGISDFRRIRNEGYYYIDKTAYVGRLEAAGAFIFFVRPRRFGKSLLVDMLKSYYDVNETPNFGKLFGDLAVGKAPTANRNRYMVLAMDFSKVGGMGGDGLAASRGGLRGTSAIVLRRGEEPDAD